MTTKNEAATTATETGRVHPAFSFPVVKKFTGKIQYRTNGAERVTTPFGDTARGEVKEVRNEKYANSLVENGDHAHVPADTPIGQPEEFRPKKKGEPSRPSVASTIRSAASSAAAAVKGAVTGNPSKIDETSK